MAWVLLMALGVVAVCAVIGGSLGLLVFRYATRDHPMRKRDL